MSELRILGVMINYAHRFTRRHFLFSNERNSQDTEDTFFFVQRA